MPPEKRSFYTLLLAPDAHDELHGQELDETHLTAHGVAEDGDELFLPEILHGLRRQFLYILQHQIIQIPCFNLVAGTGVLTQPVVGLADIVCPVNRLPHFAGEAVLAGSADLFIPHLHGFPAGGAVDQPMEQVIEGAGVAFHNGCLRSMSSCTCSHSSGVTIASWQPSMTSHSSRGIMS